MVSSQIFDNTGSTYNLPQIINADGSFNLEAYQAYSPVFLPLSLVMLISKPNKNFFGLAQACSSLSKLEQA
jgi:hypothetical protein